MHRARQERFFSKLLVERTNADKHVNIYKKAYDGGREVGRIIFQVLEVFARLTHKNYADDSQAAHHNDSHNGQVPKLLDAVVISLKPTKELVGANTQEENSPSRLL